MGPYSHWWLPRTLFWTLFTSLKVEHIAIALAAALLLRGNAARADGSLELGNPPKCQFGEIFLRFTLDAPWADRPLIEKDTCLAAALLERLLVDAQQGGGKLQCRVLVIRVEAPPKKTVELEP